MATKRHSTKKSANVKIVSKSELYDIVDNYLDTLPVETRRKGAWKWLANKLNEDSVFTAIGKKAWSHRELSLIYNAEHRKRNPRDTKSVVFKIARLLRSKRSLGNIANYLNKAKLDPPNGHAGRPPSKWTSKNVRSFFASNAPKKHQSLLDNVYKRLRQPTENVREVHKVAKLLKEHAEKKTSAKDFFTEISDRRSGRAFSFTVEGKSDKISIKIQYDGDSGTELSSWLLGMHRAVMALES